MVNRRTFLRRTVAAAAFFSEPGIAIADPLGLPIRAYGKARQSIEATADDPPFFVVKSILEED
jgi:hypothetical protein